MTRVLTCRTYLKRLNVTKQMADHLLPRAPTAAAAAGPDAADAQQQPGTPCSAAGGGYVTLFRLPVVLADEAGDEFTVYYEGSLCGPQKHLRLTAGWPAFIRAQGAGVGDAIVFERRGGAAAGVLHVRIVRGGDAAGGGGKGAANGGLDEDGILVTRDASAGAMFAAGASGGAPGAAGRVVERTLL